MVLCCCQVIHNPHCVCNQSNLVTPRAARAPVIMQPIGMPAAAMSAQQVRALLNGSASTDPEVQEQLNAAFATMTRVQLYDIMKEMKGLIAQVGRVQNCCGSVGLAATKQLATSARSLEVGGQRLQLQVATLTRQLLLQ